MKKDTNQISSNKNLIKKEVKTMKKLMILAFALLVTCGIASTSYALTHDSGYVTVTCTVTV